MALLRVVLNSLMQVSKWISQSTSFYNSTNILFLRNQQGGSQKEKKEGGERGSHHLSVATTQVKEAISTRA